MWRTARTERKSERAARGCAQSRLAATCGAGVVGLLMLATVSSLCGQTGSPAPATPPKIETLSESLIETRRKEAEEAGGLDDETKKRIAELYRQAADALKQSLGMQAQAKQFQADADNVRDRAGEIRKQIEDLKSRPPEPPPDASSLVHLEQELAKRDRRLADLKAEQTKLEAEPAQRANRRKEIRSRLQTAQQRTDEVKRQLALPPPEGEPPLLSQAKRTELLARRMLLTEDTPALNAELALYDAEEAADLVRLQRDLKAQEVNLAASEFQLVDSLVAKQREEAARAAVEQAQEEAINAQPLLKSYAQRNQFLASETQRLAGLIVATDAERKEATDVLDSLERQIEQTKQKVANVGLTDSIGSMLRKQRATLPNARKHRTHLRDRQPTIDDAHFALFEFDDERSRLANTEPIVAEILDAAFPPGHISGESDAEQRAKLVDAAALVLDRQREYLDQLIRSYNAYFDSLVELSSTEQRIINLTQDYTRYIDERVLWIRSSKPLQESVRLDESDLWLVNPTQWMTVVNKLTNDLLRRPLLYVAFAALLVTLLRCGHGFRREITEIGQQVRRGSFVKFSPTLRAALLTVLVAVPWPGLAAFLGWRLSPVVNGDEFARAVGFGLLVVAANFLPLELLRQLCRSGGLAEAHFEWPTNSVAVMRKYLQTFMVLRLPLEFVATTLQASDTIHGRDFVERILFIGKALITAWLIYRVLHPRTGVFAEYLASQRDGWLDRLKHIWHTLAVLAPLTLGTLVFVGYYYTSQQLTWRLYVTVWLLVLLFVLRAMLFRLVLVLRRKLAMQQQKERRDAQEAAEKEERGPQAIAPVEESIADLRAQTAQTRRLVSTVLIGVAVVGVWWTWVDVLPALSLLERWPLWETSSTVTERFESPDEAMPQFRQRVIVDKVTIADLAFGLLLATVTMVCARNLPGLLEIALLQRLPLDNSIRYAITSLCSYAIVFLGLVFGCNTLGLRWQQIQWLATALTFGLAFGLQEMFANFVAGIIILFERPIRVGDVVTVDDITGVVSRVRIRATTITNWDRKEFVVPNKEFITGRLLNWTLSDTVNRVVINVGVAYGSDTELARRLMEQVAREHPLILKEPPCVATFEGFGDNSLSLCLRAYLPSLDSRLETTHELHTAIYRAFRDAGIEMAFPQRDLHIRSLPPELISALADPTKANAA